MIKKLTAAAMAALLCLSAFGCSTTKMEDIPEKVMDDQAAADGKTDDSDGGTSSVDGDKEYSLLFIANGGSVSSDSKKLKAGEEYGTLPTPTRSGYKFDGWYTAAVGGEKVSSSTKMLARNVSLYANWTKNVYTLTFNANGGTASETSRNVTVGYAYGSLPSATRDGYSFDGWYTAASGGSMVSSSTTMKDSDDILYAHWIKSGCTLFFDANGGTVSEKSRALSPGKTIGTLPTPTCSGYTFDGWYTSASGGTKITSSYKMGNSDLTIYAHWTKVKYTLTFNANGGSVSEKSRSLAAGSAYGLMPTPTRDGYTFNGWYTSASGGTWVTSATTMGHSNTTVYAHWIKQSSSVYILAYDANGGIVSSKGKSITGGSAYGTLPTPTRDGYTFTGWYTAASGGSKVTSSTIMPESNQTIYAHWKAETYTLTFNANGGSVSEKSRKVSWDSAIGDLPTPTRSGYIFDGWYTSPTPPRTRISSSYIMGKANLTIYAVWIKL